MRFFDKLHIDDPVGATSVHLVCGVFGTIAVGFFAQGLVPNTTGNGLFFGGGTTRLVAQLVGVIGSGVLTLLVALAA